MIENPNIGPMFFVVIGIAIAVDWYLYTSFIQRLKTHHESIYFSLGAPTEMDSNLSAANRRLWGFLLHFQFLGLGDRLLKLFGFGVLAFSILLPGIVIWAAFSQG